MGAVQAVRFDGGARRPAFFGKLRDELAAERAFALSEQIGETRGQVLRSVAPRQLFKPRRADAERAELRVDVVAQQMSLSAVPQEQGLDVPDRLVPASDTHRRDEDPLVIALARADARPAGQRAAQIVVAAPDLQEGDERAVREQGPGEAELRGLAQAGRGHVGVVVEERRRPRPARDRRG